MKQLTLGCVAALLTTAMAAQAKTGELDITDGWRAQPMAINLKTLKDRSAPPPPVEDQKKAEDRSADELMDDDDMMGENAYAQPKKGKGRFFSNGVDTNWMPKPIALKGLLPLCQAHKGKDPADAYNEDYNCWLRKSVTVPADWKGRLVTLEQEIGGIDVVVYVNGKKAGVMLAPVGFVDVSKALVYGKANEIRLFATNRGIGSGTAGVRYRGRDDQTKKQHFFSPLKLRARASVILDDVYVQPSVRKGAIAFRCQVYSQTRQDAEIRLSVAEDASGRVVKTFVKPCTLAAGTNVVSFAEKWADAVRWEPGAPFLYVCTPSISAAGTKGEAPKKFLFGFREVWRERGQIILNGHVQSVRGFWGGGLHNADPDWTNFKKAGFNAVYQTHQHESRFRVPQATMESFARAGLLTFIGAPSIAACRRAAVDPKLIPEYARYCEYWARSVRNYPSAIGVSVGVNMMCAAWWTMGANDMGKGSGKGEIVEACRFVKKFHPNCLAFAHGDGNICDIGCSNFYFNFTPLQERLEWYASWYDRRDRADTIPYYPAEYGQPYYGSWFGGAQPSMTEWCAVYDGEKAYCDEQPRMLAEMRAFAYSKAANYYGGFVNGDKQGQQYRLYDFTTGGQKLHDRFVREVGRAWRGWGCRLSPMYLDDVSFAPAADNWELAAHSAYNGDLCVFLGGDPAKMPARFTDRTHAYPAGGKAIKSIVAVWDGLGEERLSVSWTLQRDGKAVERGTKRITLRQGDIKWEPFEVALPETPGEYELVARFDASHLVASEKEDSLKIHVYPAPVPVTGAPGVALFDPRGDSAAALAALGVKARTVRSLEDLAAASEPCLVIGRRALDALAETNCPASFPAAYAALGPKVQAGKKLLVLSQKGETWRKLGFEPEDAKPRQFFNVELPGVTDTDLSYWGGSPLPLRDTSDWHGAPTWGPAQSWHKGGRGWRWTHTHALSLVTLLTPQRTGFRALVRGEFDLAYSSLMKADYGAGVVMVCALDFEGRVGAGKCPAATKVATAMLTDFFAETPRPTRRLVVAGKDAARLATCLGFGTTAFTGAAGADQVVLVGHDADLSLADVRAAAKKGAKVLVVGSDAIAREAGFTFTKSYETQIRWGMKKMEYEEDDLRKNFKRPRNSVKMASDDDEDGMSLDDDGEDMSLEETKNKKRLPRKPKGIKDCEIPLVAYATTTRVERAFCRSISKENFEKFPYRGVGLSMLRWRESPRPSLLSPRAGWTIAADGVFAISSDGGILLDQVQPFRVLDERIRGGTGNKGDPIGKTNYSLSLDNNLRRHSLVLLNWGVRPPVETLGRFFDVHANESLYWSANGGYDPYGYVYW